VNFRLFINLVDDMVVVKVTKDKFSEKKIHYESGIGQPCSVYGSVFF